MRNNKHTDFVKFKAATHLRNSITPLKTIHITTNDINTILINLINSNKSKTVRATDKMGEN